MSGGWWLSLIVYYRYTNKVFRPRVARVSLFREHESVCLKFIFFKKRKSVLMVIISNSWIIVKSLYLNIKKFKKI